MDTNKFHQAEQILLNNLNSSRAGKFLAEIQFSALSTNWISELPKWDNKLNSEK